MSTEKRYQVFVSSTFWDLEVLPITPDGPQTIAPIGPERSAHVGRPAMRSIAGLV